MRSALDDALAPVVAMDPDLVLARREPGDGWEVFDADPAGLEAIATRILRARGIEAGAERTLAARVTASDLVHGCARLLDTPVGALAVADVVPDLGAGNGLIFYNEEGLPRRTAAIRNVRYAAIGGGRAEGEQVAALADRDAAGDWLVERLLRGALMPLVAYLVDRTGASETVLWGNVGARVAGVLVWYGAFASSPTAAWRLLDRLLDPTVHPALRRAVRRWELRRGARTWPVASRGTCCIAYRLRQGGRQLCVDCPLLGRDELAAYLDARLDEQLASFGLAVG